MIVAGRQFDTALLLRFLTEVTTKGAALLTVFALARWLGVTEFGNYLQAQAIALILAPIVLLGLAFAVIRQIAGTSLPDEVGASLTTAFSIASAVSSLIAIVICIFATSIRDLIMENSVSVGLIRTAAILLPIVAWQALTFEAMRARQHVRSTTFLQIGEALMTLSGILILERTDALSPISAIQLIAALKLVALILGLLDLAYSHRLNRSHLKFLRLAGIRSALSLGIPFMIAGLGEALMGMADRLVLGNILGAGAVGQYTAAQTLVAVLASWGAPFWWLLYPRMVKAHNSETGEDVLVAVHKLFAIFLVLGIPLAATVALLGPQLLTLALGEGFAVPIVFMAALVTAVFVNQSATPWEYHLYIEGRAALLMWSTLAWGIAAVGGIVVLAPGLGILGAAVSVAGARIGFALTVIALARRSTSARPLLPRKAAVHAALGLAGGLVAAGAVLLASGPESGPALSTITFLLVYATAGRVWPAVQARRRPA